jgi:hypothetical protein
MKLFNSKKARKERALAMIDKMIAEKRAIQECVAQGKSVSSLGIPGIVTLKFPITP